MEKASLEEARDLLRRVRRIRLHTKKLSSDLVSGEYQSAFKGQGMEFDQVREYVAGDEPRQIDWNVTARFGKPYVKSFVEERALTLLFVADHSASSLFGSGENNKSQWMAEVGAALAFNAAKKNDQVGLLLYGENVERYFPPKKGTKQALRIIREMIGHQPQGPGNLRQALEHVNRAIKGRAVIFLMSDFMDLDLTQALKVPTHRHDFVAIEVIDPLEEAPFNLGLIELEDLETGSRLLVDTDNPGWQEAYQAQRVSWREELNRYFKKYGIDHLRLTAGQAYERELRQFLRRRGKR